MALQQNEPPSPPAASSHERKDKVVSTLSTFIDTINCVKDAVPNEIAKGLLSTFSGILSAIKNTIRNKDDFTELTRQCYEISLLLWRATTATPEKTLSAPVTRAISDLQKSVDAIQDLVADRSQANVVSRSLSVSVDKEKIAGWQRDLSRFLQIFNTELNISANIKLEELIAMFEKFRLDAGTNPSPQGMPPPGRPSLFVGRDDLVHEISTLLVQSRHVALLGTGGIGKSCLAKAVLNEPNVLAKFAAQRHFVRYDDMDASQVSYDVFLGRIAGALGLTLGGTNPLAVISGHLLLAPTLLILDNAETFLDAAQDKTRIADAVDYLGAVASTVILLTTRSRALPSNVLWTVIAVPGLEPAAARDAFAAVYHNDIGNAEIEAIDELLISLDCHPLSINLLAHVARENDWSLQELLDSWNRQETQLLNTGDGKSQSLAVTLELSLSSPSLKRLGDDVLHVLQVIAFLPQGIDRREVLGLFPSLTDVHLLVDAVCKQSIAYRSGDFVTMLAPVRLYISTTYNNPVPQAMPLLKGVRAYYYDRLQVCGLSRMKIRKSGAWIKAENVNVERVVALELTLLEDILGVCTMCNSFLWHMNYHVLKPVALQSLIEAIPVPANETRRRSFLIFSTIRSRLLKRRDATSCPGPASLVAEAKGNCLHALSYLEHIVETYSVKVVELLMMARDLFTIANAKRQEAWCLRQISDVQRGWGQLRVAQKTCEEASHIIHGMGDALVEAQLNESLGVIVMHRGDTAKARALFQEALNQIERFDEFKWPKNQSIARINKRQGHLEMCVGNYDRAREHWTKALTMYGELNLQKTCVLCMLGLWEVDIREGNLAKARKLMEDAYELAVKVVELETEDVLIRKCLCAQAALCADEGNFEISRDILCSVPLTLRETGWLFVFGRTELLSGNYSEAEAFFHAIVDRYCLPPTHELDLRAHLLRVLGELSICRQEYSRAERLFTEVEQIRRSMGISIEALDQYGNNMWILPPRFNGWKQFINAK